MPPGAENPVKGPAEAAVAERVQEGVNGRVEPQQPEGDLVPVMLDAAPPAGGADDHQQGVGGPADGKHAHDDGQGLGDLLVSGQAAGMDAPAGRGFQLTHTGGGALGGDGDYPGQLQARAVGEGEAFPLDCSRPAELQVEVGVPAAAPPPANAEVNAEVEEGHGNERREELQHGSTQQKGPGVIELRKALIFGYTASPHQQLPEYDSRAVQDKGQHPDGNHLDDGLMAQALSGAITYLQSTESESTKHLFSKAAAALFTAIATRRVSLFHCGRANGDAVSELSFGAS